MYILAPEPLSMAYCINPFHQSVLLYVYSVTVARKRLGKKVTTATNKHEAIELLGPLFSIWSILQQSKVGD
jgi:hypothetical protein